MQIEFLNSYCRKIEIEPQEISSTAQNGWQVGNQALIESLPILRSSQMHDALRYWIVIYVWTVLQAVIVMVAGRPSSHPNWLKL